MGLTNDIKDTLSVASSVLQAGVNLYKASDKVDQFSSNVNQLKRSCEDWEGIAQEYGIDSDETLQFHVGQAKTQLKQEEDRLKKLEGGCGCYSLFLCCSLTTDLPDNLGKTIVDLNKKIVESWKGELVVRDAAQERAEFFATKPKFGFERDPSYVRILNVEKSVKQLLNDENQDGASQIVLLYGRAGCGKSSMARHLALDYEDVAGEIGVLHASGTGANEASTSKAGQIMSASVENLELGSHFADDCRKFSKVVYLQCGDNVTLEAKQEELLNKLLWPRSSNKEKKSDNVEGMLQQKLKESFILIILDDVWDGIFLKNMVKVFGKHVKVLTMSQKIAHDLCGQVLRHKTKDVDMDNIAPADSLSIFKTYAGFHNKDPSATIKECMKYLMKKVGGHPHAIASLAIAIDDNEDLQEWKNLVEEYRVPLEQSLPELTNDVPYEQSVLKALKVKFDRLTVPQGKLMVLLTMFEGSLIPECVVKLFHAEILLDEKPKGMRVSSWFLKAKKQLERSQCIKIREERRGLCWSMHLLDEFFVRHTLDAMGVEISNSVADLPDKVQGLETEPQINAIKGLSQIFFREKFLKGGPGISLKEHIESPKRWWTSDFMDQTSSFLQILISLMARQVETFGSFHEHQDSVPDSLWDERCHKSSHQVFLSFLINREWHRDAIKNLLISPVSRREVWNAFFFYSPWVRMKCPRSVYIDEDVMQSIISMYGDQELGMETHGYITLNSAQWDVLATLVGFASPQDKWLHGNQMESILVGRSKSLPAEKSMRNILKSAEALDACISKGLLDPSLYNEEAQAQVLLKAFEKILHVARPFHASPYFFMGRLLKFINRRDDAVKLLHKNQEEHLSMYSEKFWPDLVFHAWVGLEDWDGTLQDMDLYRKDFNSERCIRRACVKRLKKDFHGALEDLDEAVAMKPNFDTEKIIPERFHLKLLLDDKEGASMEVERWMNSQKVKLRKNDKSAFWCQESGVAKRLRGDLAGALEDLDKSHELGGLDYEVLKHQGYVKFLLGDLEGARLDAEMALSMRWWQTHENPLEQWDCLGTGIVEFLGFKL